MTTYLAVDKQVPASTQKQALSAVLFLYRHVLGKPIEVAGVIRPEPATHLPTVLSRDEVAAVIDIISHTTRLMAILLETDFNFRTVQEPLGQKNVVRIYAPTTMIYTHVLNKGPKAVRSPLDG